MSLAVNKQYYVDSYQNTRTPEIKSSQEIGEAGYEDALNAYPEEALGDAFQIEEETVSDSDSLVEELSYRMEQLQASIEGDPELRSLRSELKPIEAKLREATNPGLSEARRGVLLSAIDAMMTELDAHLANQEPAEEAEGRLAKLKSEIDGFEFPSDKAGVQRELLRKLDQASAQISLKADGSDWEEIEVALGEVESDFENLKAEVESKREEDLSEFDAKKEEFLAKIEGAKHLRDSSKEDLKARFEALATENRQALEEGSLSLDEALKAWDKLDFEAGDLEREGRLKSELETLTKESPSSGHNWEKTKALSRLVSAALGSDDKGDWQRVHHYLIRIKSENDEAANDVVMAFLGTLHYRFAGQDKEKLNEFLDLIPTEIRREMQDTVMANEGERNNYQGYENAVDRETDCVYGTPSECDEALSHSLLYSADRERNRTRLAGKEESL